MRDNSVRARLNVGKIQLLVNEKGESHISEIDFNDKSKVKIMSEDAMYNKVMEALNKIPNIDELIKNLEIEENNEV